MSGPGRSTGNAFDLEMFPLRWCFENSFAIRSVTTRAKALGLTKASHPVGSAHAAKWRAGFGFELFQPGYPGLARPPMACASRKRPWRWTWASR